MRHSYWGAPHLFGSLPQAHLPWAFAPPCPRSSQPTGGLAGGSFDTLCAYEILMLSLFGAFPERRGRALDEFRHMRYSTYAAASASCRTLRALETVLKIKKIACRFVGELLGISPSLMPDP